MTSFKIFGGASIMVSGGKLLIIVVLAIFIAISPGSAFAITADSLLQLLEEEQVVSPSKAQVIKQKAKEMEKKEAKDIWKAKWDNGLTVYREDGNFEVSVGGRIHLDFANISSPNRHFIDTLEAIEGDQYTGTGAEFRRARLKVEGLIWKFVEFIAEYDFAAGQEVAFKDVYVGLTKLPYLGTVRFGHQKEPFSLEELTSSNYITFMERALPNVFSPERNTGVLVFNTAYEKRLWWGVGAFLNTNDFG
jgi:phosphate-selective porin OprO and OprP